MISNIVYKKVGSTAARAMAQKPVKSTGIIEIDRFNNVRFVASDPFLKKTLQIFRMQNLQDSIQLFRSKGIIQSSSTTKDLILS